MASKDSDSGSGTKLGSANAGAATDSNTAMESRVRMEGPLNGKSEKMQNFLQSPTARGMPLVKTAFKESDQEWSFLSFSYVGC
ncbi:MAG: hypothetical protein Q7W53_10065 [Pseudomonadota bacterium]|nr:hypothetical protein [Pseudomonadota bacterium]